MSLNPAASLAQLKASDPAATVWVNANAGAGKTHVLVDRVVRLMLGGTEPSRIMCLTFTKAAAAEMANRLFDRLSKWIALDDDALRKVLGTLGAPEADPALLERARQLFTRALETPGGLKIQTIHAFCERVLQLFPVEAGIVPHFAMLDGREQLSLLQEARNAVLSSAGDETAETGAALRDVANRVNADDFDKLLTGLLARRASLRALFDEEHGLERAEALLRFHLSLQQGVTQESIVSGLACDVARYRDLADALAGGSDSEKKRAAQIRAACTAKDPTLIGLQAILLTGENEPRKAVANKPTLARHNWIEDFVKADQGRLLDALGKMGDLDCLGASLSLLRLGSAITRRFEAAKRARGAYDFDDLIIKTGELLQERPDAAWVLFKLDGGIEHLLVDEAQDTSPMQWQIVQALTGEFFAGEGRHGRKTRTLFVVGDRKQSIYSFQGADPNVFEQVLARVKSQVEGVGQEFREVDFSVSFRSLGEILQAVDGVFPPGSAARTGLDGESPREWEHVPNRRNASGTVELWPLVEPVEKEDPEPWQAPVDREPAQSPRRLLARKLAKTIRGWIGARMLPGRNRTVQAGDILILVRQRNSFFDAMIRALWNEQVPVAGADRLKLGDNIAVLDLVALAQFAIMPEDDHALACLLKSPLLERALTEDELIAAAAGRNALSLWHSLAAQDTEACRAAAAFLRPLIDAAPSVRPFEFFSAILGKARLRIVSRLGSEANDAIDAFLDRALDYEEAHGASLSGFVNWFEAGEIEIKRNMEQWAGEVRVMTVHGAKGLEAPIVILPDTTSDEQPRGGESLLMLEGGDPHARVPLWVVPGLGASKAVKALKAAQKDVATAEYRRLLYVAMTRACDALYVCGYRGVQEPSENCWYNTISAALTPKMTPLDAGEGWRLGADPVMAEPPAAAPMEALALPGWIARQAEAVPVAAAPAMRKRAEARVARGILIHRILQNLADLPEAGRAGHIDFAVRRAGHDGALAAQLKALIAEPVVAELLSADGHSEASIIAQRVDGSRERRRIDRLVMTGEGILIADYKTDRAVPEQASDCNPDYLTQLATYRDALRRTAPGLPLRFCLLYTEAPKLIMVPDALLDRMAALRAARP
ncbi:MAG: double-strand break repair helicase AddA [Aestuariivirga sp.]|uniref:double-strand break repair helicase AddA n=1 Tax=Aestuariivirga sp. TaxID=2650926 RepID=UPI0025BBF9C2|nr:double-strand break repair helicase AddA [Aestuariivirga sp.]MCA3561195.1 double-strand break repair helicase AddA [Aestuariivirga sp.]